MTSHIETIETKRTHDHEKIRHWAENRGGMPAVVENTWDGKRGFLNIDFGGSDESLVEISWDDFFNIFEERDLEFIYQKGEGHYYKFIDRE